MRSNRNHKYARRAIVRFHIIIPLHGRAQSARMPGAGGYLRSVFYRRKGARRVYLKK